MKIRLLILFLVTANFLKAQNSLKLDSTIDFIKAKGIKLNTVTPPSGFNVYYNCDSLLFMKGTFGDTIKIWTSSSDWYAELDDFKEVVVSKDFGETRFAKSVDDDGRICVSSYHQTVFIFRHDSLFEVVNSNPISQESWKNLFTDLFKANIDKATYKIRSDSLRQIEQKQAVYTPKLIFSKRMFNKKGEKFKTPKSLNFEGDTLELESRWIQRGKNCFLIRIKNKDEDGEETSYAYAIDEDLKFVFWEGCLHN